MDWIKVAIYTGFALGGIVVGLLLSKLFFHGNKKDDTDKHIDFMKLLVGWMLGHATIWVYCTYVLAFLGKDSIAETLSGYVAVEILGTVFAYAVKSLFENLSKHNKWPDKQPSEDGKLDLSADEILDEGENEYCALEEELVDYIEEVE